MRSKESSKNIKLTLEVPENFNDRRLDKVLSRLLPDYSRAKLQEWIKAGSVLVDNARLDQSDKVKTGQTIILNAELKIETAAQPENIPLAIVYEDNSIIVINKPAGLVVHPAAGNREHTLLNALLHHALELANIPRAGIVHRLDKETSGLLVIAKTLTAHAKLVSALKKHSIARHYQAIVCGVSTGGGTIEAAIGRHPRERTKMAVLQVGGKEAITHYRVIKRFPAHTLLEVILETGRTHQIRVHLAHIRYPVVGDPTYGGRLKIPAACSVKLKEALLNFKRQALHAASLTLTHPETGKKMTFTAPLPDDMKKLLAALA